MDTARNRSMVWAQGLRASVNNIRTTARRVDEVATLARQAALQVIESVAEELEQLAATAPVGETPSEHIRNALQILQAIDPSRCRDCVEDLRSVEDRLHKALRLLENNHTHNHGSTPT